MRSKVIYISLLIMMIFQGCIWVVNSMLPYLEEHKRLEAEGENNTVEVKIDRAKDTLTVKGSSSLVL